MKEIIGKILCAIGMLGLTTISIVTCFTINSILGLILVFAIMLIIGGALAD